MSVALSNGASVVAFIGLSINTLRGLHYLYEILESMKDAPQDLQCIYLQLRFFQLSFKTFQHSLEEAVKLGIATPLDGQARLAIDDAENTIKLFQEAIYRYGEGRATRLGTRMRVAMRKNQFGNLSRRLERTSEQIHAAHCGITMLAQNHHHQVCTANSSNLDKQLLMLHDNVSKNTTGDITEKLEAINQAVKDSAGSIINLIADISRRNDTHLIASPIPWTSEGTSSSPLPVNSRENRNQHQMLEDELVAQLTTHLSVPIRITARDALLYDPLLGDRALSQPELDDMVQRVFETCNLSFSDTFSGHTQNWRNLFPVYDLVLALVGQNRNFPVTSQRNVQMFEPRRPRSGQLLISLLSHRYLCRLKPYLAALMTLCCLLEPTFLVLGQYAMTGRIRLFPHFHNPTSDIFFTPPEPSFWSLDSPFFLQEDFITTTINYPKVITDYIEPQLDYTGIIEYYGETHKCTNLTTMSFSQYTTAASHQISEPLPEGDCIFVPRLSFHEVFFANEIFPADDDNDDIENVDEWMPTSHHFLSSLLPLISLLAIAISWMPKYRISKPSAPVCNLVTIVNFIWIISHANSLTV
ncbi:hypothetical protein IFR05_016755, partial [Cadophora sp. M221]